MCSKVLVKIKNYRTSTLACSAYSFMELSFASTFWAHTYFRPFINQLVLPRMTGTANSPHQRRHKVSSGLAWATLGKQKMSSDVPSCPMHFLLQPFSRGWQQGGGFDLLLHLIYATSRHTSGAPPAARKSGWAFAGSVIKLSTPATQPDL